MSLHCTAFTRRLVLLATWSLFAGALLLAPAARAQTAATPGKNGYIDMEKVFLGYYKTTRSDGLFKKQKDLYQQHAADGAAEIEALKKQRDEIRERSLNIALSDEVREKSRKDADEKEGLVREKEKELRDFVQTKDKELAKKYLDLRNDLVKEISDFIKKYAETQHFELVLDVSGMTRNFIPAVVYYDKSKDLTDMVLADLNKGHENEITKDAEADKKNDEATDAGLAVPPPVLNPPAADSKPEVKPEAKPEVKTDAKPEVKPAEIKQ